MNGYYVVDAIVRSYRDLRVWRFGMDLVVERYEHTKTFPTEERYGFSQSDPACSYFDSFEYRRTVSNRLSFVSSDAAQRLTAPDGRPRPNAGGTPIQAEACPGTLVTPTADCRPPIVLPLDHRLALQYIVN